MDLFLEHLLCSVAAVIARYKLSPLSLILS